MATLSPTANYGTLSNPFNLINMSSQAAAASGNTEAAQLQRDFLSVWGTNVNANQLQYDRNRLVEDTQMGARAQRARQRAFATMAGARSGYASTIHTSPLGLASNPMGKGKLGA